MWYQKLVNKNDIRLLTCNNLCINKNVSELYLLLIDNQLLLDSNTTTQFITDAETAGFYPQSQF